MTDSEVETVEPRDIRSGTNTFFLVLNIICLLVLIGLGGTWYFFATFGKVNLTEPVEEAVASAIGRSEVKESLGEPLEVERSFVRHEIWASSAGVDSSFIITGPKGKGKVYVRAKWKKSTGWVYQAAYIEIATDDFELRVDLKD